MSKHKRASQNGKEMVAHAFQAARRLGARRR